ncbi:hypothetical protein CALCODRAFT_487323 [Calocera cornea HHB12733]|uniref:Ubiquitin-like protease family profile domain-containing protein n=1 Tax=Calocera cornea HHB12733 TaxID=1353952 RepID=A0A165D6L0_9BASI|nr:hypothetical protein CALCODRAFT_487323 [Calocera cornea HHB12733]
MKENLGRWFNQKMKLLALHRHRADRLIQDSGLTEQELAEQHRLQVEQPQSRQSESVKAIEGKIDIYKRLQSEMLRVETIIREAQASIIQLHGRTANRAAFDGLNDSHAELMKKGEQLFTELHIEQAFPEFRDVSTVFLHYLVLARQEKMNIRERVIGHMWELARLHRARGGGREPLGTKLRDQILRGYGPRWSTTQAAIRRYNGYVDSLEKHFNPAWNIPLPLKLNPDSLESPTEDHHLLDDVWWPAVQPPAAWVTNEDVRHGVTGWLLRARCNEEERRLAREADNVMRWWQEERQALKDTIAQCSVQGDVLRLQRMQMQHTHIRQKWTCRALPEVKWRRAIVIDQKLASPGVSPSSADGDPFTFLPPLTPASRRWNNNNNIQTPSTSMDPIELGRIAAARTQRWLQDQTRNAQPAPPPSPPLSVLSPPTPAMATASASPYRVPQLGPSYQDWPAGQPDHEDANWEEELSDNSDAFDRVMGDADVAVEELGGTVMDNAVRGQRRGLYAEEEVEDEDMEEKADERVTYGQPADPRSHSTSPPWPPPGSSPPWPTHTSRDRSRSPSPPWPPVPAPGNVTARRYIPIPALPPMTVPPYVTSPPSRVATPGWRPVRLEALFPDSVFGPAVTPELAGRPAAPGEQEQHMTSALLRRITRPRPIFADPLPSPRSLENRVSWDVPDPSDHPSRQDKVQAAADVMDDVMDKREGSDVEEEVVFLGRGKKSPDRATKRGGRPASRPATSSAELVTDPIGSNQGQQPSGGNQVPDTDPMQWLASSVKDTPAPASWETVPYRCTRLGTERLTLDNKAQMILYKHNEWIDDQIISVFGKLFEEGQPYEWFENAAPTGLPAVRILDPHTLTDLAFIKDDRGKQFWFDKYFAYAIPKESPADEQKYDRLYSFSRPIWLLPLHDAHNSHWILVKVDFETETISFLNSLRGCGSHKKYREWVRDCIVKAREVAGLPNPGWAGWQYRDVQVIQQNNGYDCGGWLIMNELSICKGYQRSGGPSAFAFRRAMFNLVMTWAAV